MNRVIVAGLLGGVVLFVWQFISWTILPWHNMTIHSIAEGDEIVEILRAQELQSGVYHFPGMPEGDNSEAAMNAWAERYKQGPNINFMAYSAVGQDHEDPMQFIWGLIFNILAASLAAWMLMGALGSTGSFMKRTLLVTALGVFVVLTTTLPNWNWWAFPGDYSVVMAIDYIVNWFLAGLVIAWRIKPAVQS